MAEVPDYLEGWYALHDFRRIDWAGLRRLPEEERRRALHELAEFARAAESVSDAPEGASAAYQVLGHKSDLMLLHLRPSVDDLARLERSFAATLFADYTRPAYSYVSVTELSLYEATARGGTEDRERLLHAPFVQRRLKPRIPDMRYVSFYPMNKRRGEILNWYTEGLDERRRMMREHGTTGKKYHERIQQMITGSTGLDDWEWGVTLFAHDPLDLKKLVQEMRFDEVSAKYAEFGPFQLGIRLSAEELAKWAGLCE